ncbi:hypothetical protein NSE_0931 [Neorickettsia sennetsu str. Miyayama]|uniref:Uncharacterized protein n=1 Tax=Ehrlichia sennetsu (strain ATCC VR-367 / Miyayama) TaxID=222891 RepID=Q2GCK1_EHRS3|nr:hypothetical protein NSE_0931 [Neorickettsia sennetsu str. Miyayama]
MTLPYNDSFKHNLVCSVLVKEVLLCRISHVAGGGLL